MKAEEAPEKLYVDTDDRLGDSFLYGFTQKRKYDDIEYIRKDAFIEKAEKYLKNQFVKDVSVLAGGVVHINFSTAIKNFKNYMKGE